VSKNGQFNVSVYVDDIIISCNDAKALAAAALRFEEAAEAARFPVNSSKTEGPAASITAFNIELSHKAMWITKDRIVKFSEAYQMPATANSREGIESYVRSINPAQVGAL